MWTKLLPIRNPKQLTFLLWNVQGLKSKLDDCDFLNYVCEFDVLLFTETWNSKVSNVQIEGCERVVCHRHNSNSKVIRNSGGVILYYKQEYSQVIEISSINNVGIIWFKIKIEFTCSDDDE